MYQISDDYTNAMLAILDRTPELTYLKREDLRIVCLASDKKKKSGDKIVHAECRKVRGEYKGTMLTDRAIWTGDAWQYQDENETKAPDTWPEWRFLNKEAV